MKRYISFSLALGFFIGVAAFTPSVVWADEAHRYRATHIFELTDTETVFTHRVEVTTPRNVSALETLEFALPVEQTEGLEVNYGDGGTVPFSTVRKQSEIGSTVFDYAAVVLDFPEEKRGTWSFVIEHRSSEGVERFGESRVVLLPFLDGRLDAGWSANISVPSDWPLLNYRPSLRGSTTSAETRTLQVSGEDYTYPLLALSFSSDALHRVQGSYELRNSSFLPKTMRVALPLDMHNQTFSLEDINPKPTRVTLDVDGNIIAHFRMWPLQTRNINFSGTVATQQLRYDGSDADEDEESLSEFSAYLATSGFWETSEAIQDHAAGLHSENPYQRALALAGSTLEALRYDSELEGRSPAHEVFAAGEANAQGFADVLIAMLRSQGIPARAVYGSAYPSAGLYSDSHVWVEAYIAGVGWVHLDPLWSRFFGSLGSSGVDKVAWFVESESGEADMLAAYQRTVTLEPREDESQKTPDKELREVLSTRNDAYMVLPGLAVWSRFVENTSPQVVDGVRVDEAATVSLAPLQATGERTWSTGFSFERLTVTLGEEELVAAARVHWWPTLVASIIVLGGCVLQFYRWRRQRYVRQRLAHRNLS